MQAKSMESSQNRPAFVVNMDRVSDGKVLQRDASSQNMSFATDKSIVNTIEDLSIALSGIQETKHGLDETDDDSDGYSDDTSSKALPKGGGTGHVDSDDKRSLFSESATSSTHFSFKTIESGMGVNTDDNYPALYNPVKQAEYEKQKEDDKVYDEKLKKYGPVYGIAHKLNGKMRSLVGMVSNYCEGMCAAKN